MNTSITPPLGTIIAERHYRLDRGRSRGMRIIVRIGAPVRDPNPPGRDWACPYEVLVSGKRRQRAAYGIDSFQALELALRIVPTELASAARRHGGEVHLFGALDPSVPRFNKPKASRKDAAAARQRASASSTKVRARGRSRRSRRRHPAL